MTAVPGTADFPPFLLQARPAGEDVLWETFGVFETREQAEPLRDELQGSFLNSGVDLDDEGSCSPTITRFVSLLELLQEGPDALYAALTDLVTSVDEHTFKLGGNVEAMEAVFVEQMLGDSATV